MLSEEEDFLAFVIFLRGAIPESGKVVFPPRSYVSKAALFTELGFGTAMLLVPRSRQDPVVESHDDEPEPGRVRSA